MLEESFLMLEDSSKIQKVLEDSSCLNKYFLHAPTLKVINKCVPLPSSLKRCYQSTSTDLRVIMPFVLLRFKLKRCFDHYHRVMIL